jgi:hypothetical protein
VVRAFRASVLLLLDPLEELFSDFFWLVALTLAVADLPSLALELLEPSELFEFPLLPDWRSMVVFTTLMSLLQPLCFSTLRLFTLGISTLRPSTFGLSILAGTVLISGRTVLTSGCRFVASGFAVLTLGRLSVASGRLPSGLVFLTASLEDFLEWR